MFSGQPRHIEILLEGTEQKLKKNESWTFIQNAVCMKTITNKAGNVRVT